MNGAGRARNRDRSLVGQERACQDDGGAEQHAGAHRFAQKQGAPQHPEHRDQEGDRDRPTGPHPRNEAVEEVISEAGAQHGQAAQCDPDREGKVVPRAGRRRQPTQAGGQQQRHARDAKGQGRDRQGRNAVQLSLDRVDGQGITERGQQHEQDGEPGCMPAVKALGGQQHDAGKARGQPEQASASQRLAGPHPADRRAPQRSRGVEDRCYY